MITKILVIDDSPFVFKAVKKALENTAYEAVDNALNGQIGLDKFKEHNPDIVTLDVTMPIMDGLTTAKNLKAINPDTKIVMLSAMGDSVLIEEAKNIGITHFLTKPFKPEQLIEKLDEISR